MPTFARGDATLYYEEFGHGYPLLLLAPGGMRSTIDFWQRMPFDPTKEFASDFRVIGMDQRNAGQSRAPITAADSWATYAADHVALLDHLQIKRTHIMGGCIGSSFCLGLMAAAPDRVTAAVLQNPIGLSADNREDLRKNFDDWGAELRGQRPDVGEAELESMREKFYGGEFVFSVSRDFVHTSNTPMLVLAGNDAFHPTAIAEEIAKLAPNAELTLRWREPEIVAETVQRVRAFLLAHTPI